jgi:hypothetical protein
MKIVVTDLTRMRDGHICVAGIDPDTGERVRPVSGPLSDALLRRNGGPFDIGAIVELGPCSRVGRPPEIEDVRFEPSRCVYRSDMPPREFYEMCESKSAKDLTAIGSDLKKFGRSLTTIEGLGNCSLVLVSTTDRPIVFINGYNKLRFRYRDDTELSVTDVRLYKPNLIDPDTTMLLDLKRWVRDCDEFILSLGLGRPWQQPEDDRPRHYLQLNNIHLKTNPGWQLQ